MLLDLVEKFKASTGLTTPEGSQPTAPQTPPPAPAPQPEPQAASPVPAPTLAPAPAPQNTPTQSVLARDVEVKGSIRFSHALVVDGQVEGNIHSDGILTVGEHAVVKGHIKTRAAIIFGKVEGNITLKERCELKRTASLLGDISAGSLAIEEGAEFTGQSRIGKIQNLGNNAETEKPREAAPKKAPEAATAPPAAESPIRQAA